jgi:NADH:ubiquinone oxidoreductase subunit 4 (subunit M)
LNNFVGEFLVLQGAAIANFPWAAFAALGVILSAAYMLWLVQRTFYGETPEPLRQHFGDLSRREWAIALPLVALMLWMGVASQTILPSVRAGNDHTLGLVLRSASARRLAPRTSASPATLIGQLARPVSGPLSADVPQESADVR